MTEPSAAPARPRRWLEPARLRLIAVLVPVHLLAFFALYLGTLSLLETAYADAGAEAARQRLDQAVREMPFFAPGRAVVGSPHIFGHLLIAHATIGLRLYGREAEPLGPRSVSADPADVVRVRELLAQPGPGQEVWLERQGEREIVRGLRRVVADQGCTPCHAEGEVLGAASMRIDSTEPLAQMRQGLRLRVAALIGVWVVAVGAVTMLVQRSVRRSAARIEADLAAASSGRPAASDRRPLVLDPMTAQVYDGLRRALERQREREAEVAVRLQHADQLASLGQLAAGLAHEIKNPLAGIQGALEVLRDEAPEAPAAPLYGEMLGELKRVNGILQRLLESARPAPLRLVAVAPTRLLAETAELLAPALRRRKVELRVEAAEGLAAARVDPAKIRQVLMNLIQNAAEAMPDGGHVTVRASALPEGNGLVLAVADDGPGIAAADLERVFQPFFTTKYTGTGLGLAITRSLVEQHGGRIDVDSEPGRGTTFFVTLPDGGAPAASGTA